MPKESKGPKTISVFMRVRPKNEREAEHSCKNLVIHEDGKTVNVRQKKFDFHGLFGPNSKQEDVYDAYAKNAVEAAFDGQHGVLFVYGQTGSGKTFTMSNEEKGKEGMLQRALNEMWTRIAADTQHEYNCSVSYVQLYNELLDDLLNTDNSKNRVRLQLGPEGLGDVVLMNDHDGTSIEKEVKSYQDCMKYFETGASMKVIAETKMNKVSSRSHTVFTLHVRKARKTGAIVVDNEAPQSASNTTMALEGRFVVCDLAGSERVSKTHAAGQQLVEAASINKSLLTLGNVVSALTDKKAQHVPFRDSKLTRLLQYSLMGNGNTSLIINTSPSDDNTEETLSAIAFGQRAIRIKQDAKRHEVIDYKALYLQLQAQLDSQMDNALQEALAEEKLVYEEQIAELKDKVKFLETENNLLRSEGGGKVAAATPAAKPVYSDPEAVKALNAASAGASSGDFSVEGWKNIAQSLKVTVEDREKKLRQREEERTKIGHLLMAEKQKSFNLGKKLYALAVRLKDERSHHNDQLDVLNGQLASAMGTDYVDVNRLSQEEPDLTPSAVTPQSPVDTDGNESTSPTVGVSAAVQMELDRAHQAVRLLKQERIDLIIYQAKAQQAIHYLANKCKAAGIQ